MGASEAATGVDLTPYVPRVTLEWALAEPGARARTLEGTLVFVDISGFTRLSERLSEHGKAGAEEVTEVMNATFAALLEVAYAYGGSLLKFGGDALLLFYAGDAHAERAATAAHGMRAALRRIARPETSAGRAELRMHVGVHAGAFHVFLVGDRHRELVVAGPGATRTGEMEAAAGPGEILLSAEAAALLPPRVLGAAREEGRLLRSSPGAPEAAEALPELGGLDLGQFVPPEVRETLAQRTAEPEHRQAAVAFVRFSGVDTRLATEPAAVVAEAIHRLVAAVQDAAEEYGVCFLESDIDRDGGRLVLVAGAPRASENDEERLLRAVRAVFDAAPALPLHAGVSRGRVFAGEVGFPFRRTYTILGGTAALAARLMARAGPGQILTTAEVLERSRTAFATIELEPWTPKGKAAPVVPLAVGAVAGARGAQPRGAVPLVDRQRELAVLDAAVQPVRLGFGSFVELVGEPGIGKSRLVDELRSRAGEMPSVAAACEQYESSTPYHAFREVLRALLGVPLGRDPAANTARLRERIEPLDPELVPWIPLLADPLDVPVAPTREVDELAPAFRRARLHGVVGRLLERLLSGPTVLVFEDVHWMDEASSELLRHLGAQITSHPWYACTTRRPVEGGFAAAEGTPPVPALTLRLEPLPADDARQLVEVVAGAEIDAAELEAIAGRAGGNPLFIQELVAAATRAEAGEELPETVEAVVAARIDDLAPPDRALLRWASVLGQAFDGRLLERVLADDPEAASDSDAWERLVEFVERDPDVAGGFRFRHALIRDAAYEGLSFRRRRELHLAVGRALEELHGERAGEHAEVLSLHFARAQAWQDVWAHALTAAERARSKSASALAAELYGRALDAARRLPELDAAAVAAAWEARGDAAQLGGLFAQAQEAFRAARRLVATGSPAEVSLLRKEGVIRERQGRYGEALRWYGRALAVAQRLVDDAERTRRTVDLRLDTAGVRFRQGRFREAAALARGVVDDAARVEHLAGLAHAYYLLHSSLTLLADDERVAYRGLALPMYEDLGDLSGQAAVLNNLGVEAYYEGRWDDALDLWERSRDLRRRLGDVVGAATLTGNIGEIKSDQGRLDEARADFEEMLAVVETAGSRHLTAVAAANLGRLAARAGEGADALDRIGRALAEFREIGAAAFEREADARLAEAALLTGDGAGALAQAEAALAALRVGDAVPMLEANLERVRGLALAAGGREGEARAALERSLELAEAAKATYEQALTLAALAALERRSGSARGEELARRSAALLDGLGVVALAGIPHPARPTEGDAV